MICLYPVASIVLQYHAMGQTVLCSHSQSVKVWYFGIPTFCNCILFEHAGLPQISPRFGTRIHNGATYLYICHQRNFTNGTFEYEPVSPMSGGLIQGW